MGFEGVAVTPNENMIVAILEGAMKQDPKVKTQLAIYQKNKNDYELKGTTCYPMDNSGKKPLEKAKVAGADTDLGVSEMLALDNNGNFLTIERQYGFEIVKNEKTNDYKLDYGFQIHLMQTTIKLDDIKKTSDCLKKTEVLNLETIASQLPMQSLHNFEGMTLGPKINGKNSLILVSDNNFNQSVDTVSAVFILKN